MATNSLQFKKRNEYASMMQSSVKRIITPNTTLSWGKKHCSTGQIQALFTSARKQGADLRAAPPAASRWARTCEEAKGGDGHHVQSEPPQHLPAPPASAAKKAQARAQQIERLTERRAREDRQSGQGACVGSTPSRLPLRELAPRGPPTTVARGPTEPSLPHTWPRTSLPHTWPRTLPCSRPQRGRRAHSGLRAQGLCSERPVPPPGPSQELKSSRARFTARLHPTRIGKCRTREDAEQDAEQDANKRAKELCLDGAP
jgi:hypothetical protein